MAIEFFRDYVCICEFVIRAVFFWQLHADLALTRDELKYHIFTNCPAILARLLVTDTSDHALCQLIFPIIGLPRACQ